MKSQIACFWLLLLIPFFGFGQLWQPVGGGLSNGVLDLYSDSASNKVYLCGVFHYAGDSLVNETCSWNGTNFEKIGLGLGAYDFSNIEGASDLHHIVPYQGNVFVGGKLTYFDGTNYSPAYFHRFDGQVWDSCGPVNSLALPSICDNELFALGYFTDISGNACSNVAKWNGNSWDCVGGYFDFGQGYSITIENYLGDYYVGGNFTNTAGKKEIIRWDGSNWQALGAGILGDSWVNRIVAYKGVLYVGGSFHAAEGNADDFLMAWDGSQWLPTFYDVQFTTQILKMEVFDDELYMLGQHYVWKNGAWRGPFNIAKFDGTNFCSFGGNIAPVYDIGYLNGQFYIATNSVVNGDTLQFFAEYIGGPQVETCVIETSPNGIPKPQIEQARAFPNPTRDFVKIEISIREAGNAHIQIVDVSGRLISEVAGGYRNVGEATFVVDLSGYPSGTYFAIIECGSQRQRAMIVKE